MNRLEKAFRPIKQLGRSLQRVGMQIQRSVRSTFFSTGESYPHGYDQPLVTLPYPHATLPVPTRGRYQLDNRIEDCIGCDKCARVCPVDCIEIEGIPAPEVIGLTSNGMKKRIHLAKFNIDMAKCCFCGLCTTVCPTDCLTMTPTYDFSVFDIAEHTFSFATMTEQEIADKKQVWQRHQANQRIKNDAPPIA